jgi:putative Mn2+ efflux pump MntP
VPSGSLLLVSFSLGLSNFAAGMAAAALSIDNLIVGFALGVRQVPILVAAAIIAFVSVAMAVVGLQLGDRLGERFESLSEEVGGAVLALVGVALAAGVL